MPNEVLKALLECGVHFGHQTRRWNPKMKRFIFGERSGIYIIDLEKTKENMEIARDYVRSVAATGGRILFVGTKKQAKDLIAEEAARSGMPYINNRWMGGLLTNFETVRKSLDKLRKIEKMAEDGVMENLKKKEVASLNKEKEKLLRDLGGIRDMKDLPKALFVIDSKREDIAIKEAARLKMPVVALIDTNCDPDPIQYPIPGNDDALKSIRYITAVITDAILAGQNDFREAQAVRAKAAEAATAQASAPAPEAKPAETAADPQAVTDQPEQPVEETRE